MFKGWSGTKNFHSYILFLLITFTTEEITGCTNEAAKGANNAPRNPPSCFFYNVFITPSINTVESFNGFIVFIISFISSFEINETNLFLALAAPFPLIFLSNLFITLEGKLLTNPSMLSLAKGIATFVSTFFS